MSEIIFEGRSQRFAAISGVPIEAAREFYGYQLAADLERAGAPQDVVVRYAADQPAPLGQPSPKPPTAEPTAEPSDHDAQMFAALMQKYFSDPANCAKMQRYLAGDSGKEPAIKSKEDMERALKAQAQTPGMSPADAVKATQGANGLPRYTADELRVRLDRNRPPMTREECQAALRYQAESGCTAEQARDAIRRLPQDQVIRYASDGRYRVDLGTGWTAHGSALDGGGASAQRSSSSHVQEIRAERQRIDVAKARMQRMADETGLPLELIQCAYGSFDSGQYSTLEAAVSAEKERRTNRATFGSDGGPAISLTSLQRHV